MKTTVQNPELNLVPIVSVENLHVSFPNESGHLRVVRGVSYTIKKGEIFGFIGESGSGKTVTCSSLLKLPELIDGGLIKGHQYFNEGSKILDLSKLTERELYTVRGKQIAYIFQNPTASLNPNQRIGTQLTKVCARHGIKINMEMLCQALLEVGLDEPEQIAMQYAHTLSGGQNQRVMIAQALLLKPQLLIADEPTSAIDADVRYMVLELLKSICTKYKMSLLIITHDFDVAKRICERMAVFYGGLIVEMGPTHEVLNGAKHPYTQALIQCADSLNDPKSLEQKKVFSLEGAPLTPQEFTDGCPFLERCKFAMHACKLQMPPLVQDGDHLYRCLLRQGVPCSE